MKKRYFVLSALLCLGLTSCFGDSSSGYTKYTPTSYGGGTNTNTSSSKGGETNTRTDDEDIVFEDTLVTISRYGSSNSQQDVDNAPIIEATNKESLSLSGLTKGKMVLVKVQFVVSNKSSSPYSFSPYITISHSKGYQLANSSDEAGIIKTINEGTKDESIEVSGLSRALRAGVLHKTVTYEFLYSCTKNTSLNTIYQEWSFYVGKPSNGKGIHDIELKLLFPTNYDTIPDPTFSYGDNSIVISDVDEKVSTGYYYFEGSGLREFTSSYTIPVLKSGKYELKLCSNDLITQDYDKSFEAIVLDAPTNVDWSEKAKITFVGVDKATEYNVEIVNQDTNVVIDRLVTHDLSFDFAGKVSSYDSGWYDVRVYANSSENLVFKSVDYGGSGEYGLCILDAPVVSVKNRTLSWKAVEGASKYSIYRNDDLIAETEELSYKDSSFVYGDAIYVVANSSYYNCFDSKASNKVKIMVL